MSAIGRLVFLLVGLSALPLIAAPDLHIATGRAHLNAGRGVEARKEFDAAMQEYRKAGDQHGEAVALMFVGVTDVRLNNIDAARGELNNAAMLLDKNQDYLGSWLAFLVLVELEKGMGLYTAGFAWLAEAEKELEKLKDPNASFTLATFLTMATESGPQVELVRQLNAQPGASILFKSVLVSSFVEPFLHDSRGSLLLLTGQLDKAESEFKAAIDGAEIFAGSLSGTFAAHLGDLEFRRGKFDAAITQYQRARQSVTAMPWRLGDQLTELGILGRLAETENAAGRLEQALAWNDEALSLVRSSGNQTEEASLYESRAHLLLLNQRYEETEAALQRALLLTESTHDVSRQASIEGDLGGLDTIRGDYGSSATHFETSIELYQSLNDPMLESSAWVGLTIAYLGSDSDVNAERMLRRSRDLAERSQFDLQCSWISFLEAIWKYRKGAMSGRELIRAIEDLEQTPEAADVGFTRETSQLMQQMIAAGESSPPDPTVNLVKDRHSPLPLQGFVDILEGRKQLLAGNVGLAREIWKRGLQGSTFNREWRAGFMGLIGASYWKEGKADEAIDWFSKSAREVDLVVSDLHASFMVTSFLGSERRAYYDILVELLARSERVEDAFDAMERARTRAFLRLIGNRRIHPNAGAEPALAREAEELRLKIATWEEQPIPNESLTEARTEFQALLQRLQVTDPEYASLTDVEPLKLDAIRRELPAETTLLAYFVSGFGVHAWILDATSLEHVKLSLDQPELARITCWATQLGYSNGARGAKPLECGTDPTTAEDAYTELIAPVRAKIHNSRLLIIPHGPLHYVPFAALRDPTTRRYLIEDYTLLHGPSASSLRFLKAKETPVDGTVLILGDPATAAQPALPGAKREAERVAERFDTKAKTGREAKESLLSHLDGKVDLLHIAAHGTYDSATPLFSSIALAAGEGADGRLEVNEILSSLDLSGVNLVVLSACSSGIGKRSGGDEILGLTRSLLYAGTPGVISTLWSIDDEATTPLMEKFYDRLLGGASIADSLRGAQLELLHDERYADPRYWAAFFLIGDPQARWSSKR
ncbi:MAG: CHAT domain-containing protein [Acidobacteria bacterium]|nr:CHAT domain-containing protein [Acidobacteriota bacterium]